MGVDDVVIGRVIDAGRLTELRQTLGSQKLDRLLRMLAGELTQRPAGIRSRADAGDLPAVRSQAHSLKGAVASFGVVGVARAAKAVELAAPGAELDVALARLDSEVSTAVRSLESMLG